jgi:hypothetical protein
MDEHKQRISAAFGKRICEMTDDELQDFLAKFAQQAAEAGGERGAAIALAKVGLADEAAGADIKTIRDFISGFRLFRRGAVTTAISGTSKIVGWSIVFSLAAFLSAHFHFLKPILDKITEPPAP